MSKFAALYDDASSGEEESSSGIKLGGAGRSAETSGEVSDVPKLQANSGKEIDHGASAKSQPSCVESPEHEGIWESAKSKSSSDINRYIGLIEVMKNRFETASTRRTFPEALKSFINVSSPKHFYKDDGKMGNYTIYTFTLKVGRKHSEDSIYASNPELLKWISRAHSIVLKDNVVIGVLEGPTKFSGKSDIDEDPEEDAEPAEDEIESNSDKIYDHSKVLDWARNKQLKIVRTTKENGKFAIMTIMVDPITKESLIVFGSKNYHLLLKESDLISNKFEKSREYETSSIIRSIFDSIKESYDQIRESLKDKFSEGYSLVGESCDGQHFTDGDGKIKWFGLFRNGNPLEVVPTLSYLREKGVATVDFKEIYDSTAPDSEGVNLEALYLESRCMEGEGSVLYNMNTVTKEAILVKTKSVQYIVKRMLREKIKNGYMQIEAIRDRFVNAKSYHGLNTEAAIRITRQLLAFALFMLNKCYPGAVLGHQEVKSVRGQLPNGFNTYWKEFVRECPEGELVVTKDDFGFFDERIYLENTKMYPNRDLHKNTLVVFIQGLQGSGKSTIAHNLKELLCSRGINTKIIEQDICYGDTNACQSQLFHWSSDGQADVLIVSRCNISSGQYTRYLAIAEERNCKVMFFSPRNFDELYYVISLSGILNRSKEGDSLLVGRFESNIDEVVDFTYKNYQEYEKFKATNNTYLSFDEDNSLLLAAREVLRLSHKSSSKSLEANLNKPRLISFVRENFARLHQLRRPIDEIIQKDFLDKILSSLELTPSPYLAPQAPENTIYVGFFLDPAQRAILLEFAKSHLDERWDPSSITEYCEHITQGKDLKKMSPIAQFSMVDVTIDSLIISQNKYVVFNVSSLSQGPLQVHVETGHPHITCFTPCSGKPKDSIQVFHSKGNGCRTIQCTFNFQAKCLYIRNNFSLRR